MTVDLIIVLICLAPVIVVVPYLIVGYRRMPEVKEKEREVLAQSRLAAEAQYRAHRVSSNDPRYCVDPDTATIVVDDEVYGRSQPSQTWYYRVEHIVRNPSGEYFKIIYGTSDILRCSHIAHRVAKIVLKARYLPPGK
ncbi:hypothetical protein [Roseateles noduli]|uniref:hypothetical protein n=1 Tax=Roseateles noduli TaxID=2052484 RepID=UPI003D64AC88